MNNSFLVLTVFVFAVFLLDWLAVGFSWRQVEWIMKPLAMIMVILWTLTAAGWNFEPLLLLLLLAQGFGLVGDVFLMLKARWFLMGLGAFLLGHLFYVSMLGWFLYRGFFVSGPTQRWIWGFLIGLGIWLLILISFYGFVAPKSPRLTMPLLMWIPIQFYGWILSILVFMSILVVIITPTFNLSMVFLPIGSFLFYISDSLLAYDRFKRKMPKIRVWVMITYHLAQFSLAWGFLAYTGFM